MVYNNLRKLKRYISMSFLSTHINYRKLDPLCQADQSIKISENRFECSSFFLAVFISHFLFYFSKINFKGIVQ